MAGTGGGGNEDWYTSGRESPMYSYGNYREPMDANQQLNVASSSTNPDEEDYENEPPLLEELGIRFDHILSKTQAVINPTKVRISTVSISLSRYRMRIADHFYYRN